MTHAHVFLSGYVQGVGFRNFVYKEAEKLGLAGWVRNLTDGRVEAVLQGDKKKIRSLIELCKIGPMFSRVEDIKVDWEEIKEEYKEFTIR